MRLPDSAFVGLGVSDLEMSRIRHAVEEAEGASLEEIRARLDGLLTPEQVRRLLQNLGL